MNIKGCEMISSDWWSGRGDQSYKYFNISEDNALTWRGPGSGTWGWSKGRLPRPWDGGSWRELNTPPGGSLTPFPTRNNNNDDNDNNNRRNETVKTNWKHSLSQPVLVSVLSCLNPGENNFINPRQTLKANISMITLPRPRNDEKNRPRQLSLVSCNVKVNISHFWRDQRKRKHHQMLCYKSTAFFPTPAKVWIVEIFPKRSVEGLSVLNCWIQ